MPISKKFTKGTIRSFISILSSGIYSVLYFFVIYIFYSHEEEYDYGYRGYIVLLLLYFYIFTTLISNFGASQFGSKRILDIMLSADLSIILSNIIAYFVLGLIEGHLVTPIPFFYLIFAQLLLSPMISYLGSRIVRAAYPPKKALVVFGDIDHSDIIANLKKYQSKEFVLSKEIFENDIDYSNINDILNDYECVIGIDISHESKKSLAKACYEKYLRFYDVPSITDVLIKSSDIINFLDTPIFKLNKFGPSQLERIAKRAIDLFGGVILLIVASPIMLVSAIIIKLQDGGDVLFRQKRLTLNGKEFELVKFRSMIMNAEPNGKAIRAKENDDRITPFGKFLRKTRFDELPQVFNILKGDLSFVGPRALRIEEYEQNEEDFPEFRYRLKVKAGLTGYAQVYGKYNTSFRDKLLLDIYYIENFSLVMDIKLILMTIVTIFKKDSTEGF